MFNPRQVRLGVTFREPFSSACGRFWVRGSPLTLELEQRSLDYQTLSLEREKRTIGFGAFSQPVEMYLDRPAVLSHEANTWKIIGRKINDGFAVLLFKCDQVRQIPFL